MKVIAVVPGTTPSTSTIVLTQSNMRGTWTEIIGLLARPHISFDGASFEVVASVDATTAGNSETVDYAVSGKVITFHVRDRDSGMLIEYYWRTLADLSDLRKDRSAERWCDFVNGDLRKMFAARKPQLECTVEKQILDAKKSLTHLEREKALLAAAAAHEALAA